MKIKFEELPHEIQIEIIETLYSYKECHIEHRHGKMEVCTSYGLKSKYAEDEWISQPFTKDDLDIYCPRPWGYEWADMTDAWEYMTAEEKKALYDAANAILRARAERHLKNMRY